jgi:ribosome-associated heat shock protein Hsp15
MIEPSATAMRIDKWLWAARFFKTRTVAAEAVEGGHVHVQGIRVKPAKEIRPGDLLEVVVGDLCWKVVVRGLAAQRRPAPEARLLYEETAESRQARERQLENRKLAGAPDPAAKGRPTKRNRRQMQRFFG